MIAGRVFASELLKLRRARVVWILTLAFCLAPLMVAFMMAVLLHPDLAGRMGLLTTKARLTIPAAEWGTYLRLITTVYAGGLVVLATAQAFVFGREYGDAMAADLLALPLRRAAIVAAKLAASFLWFAAMAALVWGVALAAGAMVGMPGWDGADALRQAARAAWVVLQVALSGSVAALLAVVGRGFLAPIGASVGLLLVGNLFAATGWAPWVPWALVLRTAGAVGPAAPPAPAPMLVLVGFFLLTAVATIVALERGEAL